MIDEKRLRKLTEVLSSIALFSELGESEIERLISDSRYLKVGAGDNINSGSCLPVIISGRAAAVNSGGVTLRLLASGSIFGVTTLFGDDAVSDVVAETAVEALLIPRAAVSALIRSNGDFAEKYIRLLNEKIRFLNGRIKAFTAENVSVRLACYLLTLLSPSDGIESRSITLEISLSRLAKLLNIGRASLYRALAALEQDGLISHSERNIVILDICGLRRLAEKENAR